MCEGDTRLQRHYDSVSQTCLELMDVSMQSARTKFRSFSIMFCCCYLFQLCLLLHIVCHTCATSNKLCKLFELCVCLIFLLCCNHFTLMLYYRQHLCVALSAEACEIYLK